jgi:16S rRNA U516 pseudouridylate synthase RsuA-like enzyme
MNEEVFNMSVRKFLKTLGVTSQREIEKAIRDAVAAGRIPAGGTVKATARVTIDGVDLDFSVDGVIDLG